MFKISSFEDEIYKSMEKQLVANQTEDTYGFNKLAQVADYLNKAAEIFDEAGMIDEANQVTLVLKNLLTK